MGSPIKQVKFVGKTSGSSLTTPILKLANVAVANRFRNIGAWFESIGLGARTFNGYAAADGVQATGTVTLGAFVATNTVTINGVVFTGVASAPTGNQFLIGGSSTITAANLVNAINATTSAAVANNVSASSVGAVITLTMKESGTLGNFGTLAISANGSVSGANFTGGTDGTVVNIVKGI